MICESQSGTSTSDSKLSELEERLLRCESQTGNLKLSEQAEQVTWTIRMDNEEAKLNELKKNNLVYFRVPESTSKDVAQRIQYTGCPKKIGLAIFKL